jgi:hypothetical protein
VTGVGRAGCLRSRQAQMPCSIGSNGLYGALVSADGLTIVGVVQSITSTPKRAETMKTPEAYEADKAARQAQHREATVVALALAVIALRATYHAFVAIATFVGNSLNPLRGCMHDATELADSFHN